MTAMRRERARSSDTFDSHEGPLLIHSFSDSEDEKRWVVSDVGSKTAVVERSNSSSNRGNATITATNTATNSAKYYEHSQMINDQPLESSIMKYKEEMRKRRMTKTNKSQLCRYTVDRVQGILLPKRFSSFIPVSVDDTDEESGEHFKHPSRIPLIKGLERVTSGAQPASEVVTTCGLKPHRFIWFIISGLLCDIVQFFIDLTLYYVFKVRDTTLCWSLGFAISIIVRHTSHRYLVFGNYVGGYWYSLLRMYAGYSISLTLSTVLNWLLTHKMSFQHYTAWMITLVGTNITNYFLLLHLWKWDWSKGKMILPFCKRKSKVTNDEISSDGLLRQVV